MSKVFENAFIVNIDKWSIQNVLDGLFTNDTNGCLGKYCFPAPGIECNDKTYDGETVGYTIDTPCNKKLVHTRGLPSRGGGALRPNKMLYRPNKSA